VEGANLLMPTLSVHDGKGQANARQPTPVIVSAIARELAGFVWSIACFTSDPPAKTSATTTTSDEVCPTKSAGVSRPLPRAPSPAAEGHGVPGANCRAHCIALRNGGQTMPRGREDEGEHSSFAHEAVGSCIG
jgi:hypothetical protein